MNKDRVILIRGDSSKWYEQAIFIVKKNAYSNKMPIDLVEEAEKIVNNYDPNYETLQTVQKPEIKKKMYKNIKRNSYNFVLSAIMIVGCIMLASILFFSFI